MTPRQDAPLRPVSGPVSGGGALETERAAKLAGVRAMARLLDEAVRVPGTGIGVGLDALIGLIPGVGDLAGGAMSAYVLVTAARLGVPKAVLGRMLVNLGTDALVGAVPLLGDLFDIGFKANKRNVRLLEASLEAPAETRRSSALVIGGVAIAAMVIAAIGVMLTVLLLRAVWDAAGG